VSVERLRTAAAGVAPLLIAAAAFLGRAHSIDDPLYLAAARHLLAHPFDPLGAPTFWHDRPATFFSDSYNPPLVSYLLALPVALTGGSELSVHVLMLALGVWAVLVARRLGAQLRVPAEWATLLAASPILAVCAVSAMADVPFLLLTLLSWEAAFSGRGLRAGLLAGLSALTKYAGVLNLLLVLGPLRGRGRPLDAAAGAIVVGAWYAWTGAVYGAPHPLVAARYAELRLGHQAELAASLVASLGLAGLPAALGLLRWDRVLMRIAAGAGLTAAALALPAYGPAGAALAALAFASGVALLVAAARATARGGSWPALAFWLPAGYVTLVVYFGAARYVLPLLPPLLWLLVRGGQMELEASRRRWGLALGTGLAAGLAFLWADAGYARSWRELAERLPPDSRCHEVGHWGFQHHAEARGCVPLDPRAPLEEGDLVASAEEIHGAGMSPAQAAVLRDAGRLTEASPALRVMDRAAGAGLWSSAWGILPLGLRGGVREVVALGRVQGWLLTAGMPLPGEGIALDLGSSEARHTLLDGWSGDEAFEDGGARRNFVWSLGPESALRVPVPRGATRLRLSAFPSPAAVGDLHIRVGTAAEAVVPLEPGWHDYDVPVRGPAEGGSTLVVLRASGHRPPGRLGRERRALAVAVDRLELGSPADGAARKGNRGAWPARVSDAPGLLVARGAALVAQGRSGDRFRLSLVSAGAAFSWLGADGSETPLWRGRSGRRPAVLRLTAPADGHLVVRAERAFVSDLVREPWRELEESASRRSFAEGAASPIP
jgi:hypothetical protein